MSVSSVYSDTAGARQQPFPSFKSALRSYTNVLYALVLHDIKNRFFGTGLGQIVMIIWPFVHIIVLFVIWHVTGRQVPYGDSLVLYSATGVVPFIVCTYMSRWIVYSAMTNRTFLQYPIIKPLDLLIGRALLEVVSAFIVTIMVLVLIVALGADPWPVDCVQAAYAYGATLFLAFGLGIVNGAITLVVPLWNLVFVLFILMAYVSSGILFVVSNMPEQIRTVLAYNPLLQCVEWMRVAYYADYPTLVLDRSYVLEVSLVALALGLLLERIVRRYV